MSACAATSRSRMPSNPPFSASSMAVSRMRMRVSSMLNRNTFHCCIATSDSPSQVHGELTEAIDEARAVALRRAGQRHLRVAAQHLLEHQADLEAGEGHAEADVLAGAEGQVLVGHAADVEAVRVGEHLLVAVGRDVVEDH